MSRFILIVNFFAAISRRNNDATADFQPSGRNRQVEIGFLTTFRWVLARPKISPF
jgi:hypothetical protein